MLIEILKILKDVQYSNSFLVNAEDFFDVLV